MANLVRTSAASIRMAVAAPGANVLKVRGALAEKDTGAATTR